MTKAKITKYSFIALLLIPKVLFAQTSQLALKEKINYGNYTRLHVILICAIS
jgi:hypothetical protein